MLKFKFVVVFFGVWLWLWMSSVQPAIASIHTYPEGSDRVMVRSLHTLRDDTDRAWQVVLFKRAPRGLADEIHLRLVGFPNATEFSHPAALHIAGSDYGWTATDVLLTNSPFPANVGEYDLATVMAQLQTNAALHLVLPLQPRNAELLIPPFVVKEWRAVATGST